jgi:hypothetical protein
VRFNLSPCHLGRFINASPNRKRYIPALLVAILTCVVRVYCRRGRTGRFGNSRRTRFVKALDYAIGGMHLKVSNPGSNLFRLGDQLPQHVQYAARHQYLSATMCHEVAGRNGEPVLGSTTRAFSQSPTVLTTPAPSLPHRSRSHKTNQTEVAQNDWPISPTVRREVASESRALGQWLPALDRETVARLPH